ncbi:MAG: hypothetical protein PVG64_00480 [Syntrophobacterales bacterium]
MVDRLKGHPWKSTSVGDETDSNCPRCKEETIHRVVAMMEEKVHVVICTRCGSQHKYRPSLSAMRKKVPLPSERQARLLKKIVSEKASQDGESLEDWRKLKEFAGEVQPLPYDQSVSYHENQAIEHPTFGLGFVRTVIDASKVEVVFEHEVKVLAMNRLKSD